MPDPWQRPVPGQPFVPNAAQFGLFLDTSRDVQQLKRQLAGAGKTAGGPTYVLVRNQTGADIDDLHGVVGLGVPIITPADRESVVHEEPVFSGVTPDVDLHLGQFAVLTTPLASGKIGRAVISGVAWVLLDLDGEAAVERAEIADTETGHLIAHIEGSATVLWHDDEPSGGGPVWALVRLSNPGGASPDDPSYPTNITNCGCFRRYYPPCPDPLPEATICCDAHYVYEANLALPGGNSGVFSFYHQGGDIYSTFSEDEDEDNPYTHDHICCLDDPPPELLSECETIEQEEGVYDFVMDLSETPPRIRMEARTPPASCPPLCAEWLLANPVFQCNMVNEFQLGRFSGWPMTVDANANLFTKFPRCVCVIPAGGCPDGVCEEGCEGEHSGETLTMTLTVSGLSGSAFGLAPCGHFNRSWTLAEVNDCVWRETHTVGGIGSYYAIVWPLSDGASFFATAPITGTAKPAALRFYCSPLGEGAGECARYEAAQLNCDGVTTFDLVSSAECSGWPSTIDVTMNYA